MADSSSDLIDHYKLNASGENQWKRHGIGLKSIGEGACGTVWLEIDREEPDGVAERAVKEIRKSRMRMFQIDIRRELLAMAKLSKYQDEGLFVNFLGWFHNDEAMFLAMKYCPYGDLGTYVAAGFTEADTKVIMRQLLEGLEIMHENNFAHRDLKPQNIFAVSQAPNWWVKIGDFGVSKRAEEEVTNFRTEVGTRPYQAPEILGIIQGNEENFNYTNAVDLWSLGCVCFQMLSGVVPFPNRRSLEAFCYGIQPFPRARLIMKSITANGVALIADMITPLPSERLTANKALHRTWFNQGESPDGGGSNTGKMYRDFGTKSIDHIDLLEQPLVGNAQNKIESYDRDISITLNTDMENSTLGSWTSGREESAFGDGNGESKKIFSLQSSDRQAVSANTPSTDIRSKRTEREIAIDVLLQAGYEIMSASFVQSNPFFWAPGNEQDSMIQLLTRTSTNLDATYHVGHPLLSNAAWYGCEIVVRLLLEGGAEVNTKDISNRTTLIWATQSGSESVVELLLDNGAEVNAEDSEYMNALIWAVRSGSEGIVKLLIQNGAEINAEDYECRNALIWAIRVGSESMTQLLLEFGADINHQDLDDSTALMEAAKGGYETIVRQLLQDGATIDTQDKYGNTALLWALKGGYGAIAGALLDMRADIHGSDGDRWTTLIWAAFWGYEDIVQRLIDNGAVVGSATHDGQTALDMAAFRGHKAIVKLLKQANSDWFRRFVQNLPVAPREVSPNRNLSSP